MAQIIWKSFKLGELFSWSSRKDLSLKNYNKINEYEDGYVEVVTGSKTDKNEFIAFSELPENYPVYNDCLCLNTNGSIGYCIYYDRPIISPTSSVHILIHKFEQLKLLMSKEVNSFLSQIITKMFTTGLYNRTACLIGQEKFDREIIMLPCLPVTDNAPFIWQEDDKKFTLAVDYINDLMQKAKVFKEQKTIKLYEAERAKYEAERAKYEAERAKYEAEYLHEKQNLVWKSFKLGELFEFSSTHSIGNQIKNLTIFTEKENGTIANVTASKENNGIIGYIQETEDIKKRKKKNILTIAPDAAYAGICFYQSDYVVSTGHNKIIEIKNENLKVALDKNSNQYLFLAKILTKMFCKTFYGFSKSITDSDFSKNIIMLPCLPVTDNAPFIWQENDKKFTLATNYISYLYLSGKVNHNQKLIENYTYKY